jgi:hypothetical protein
MQSRSCPQSWIPDESEKKQYIDDCKQYEENLENYSQLAKEWNELGGGSFPEFLEFIKT